MKLSKRKIELLREFCDFLCEECHRHEKEIGILEPHRVKQGGDYSLRNIKMCCKKCHKTFSQAQRIAEGIQAR